MGQSTHTGCQGGCQRAYCPIRRDWGSSASLTCSERVMWGDLQIGENERHSQKVGPSGTSYYLVCKTIIIIIFLLTTDDKKWLFGLGILTVKGYTEYFQVSLVINNQLCVVCVLVTVMSPILYLMFQFYTTLYEISLSFRQNLFNKVENITLVSGKVCLAYFIIVWYFDYWLVVNINGSNF